MITFIIFLRAGFLVLILSGRRLTILFWIGRGFCRNDRNLETALLLTRTLRILLTVLLTTFFLLRKIFLGVGAGVAWTESLIFRARRIRLIIGILSHYPIAVNGGKLYIVSQDCCDCVHNLLVIFNMLVIKCKVLRDGHIVN